MSDLDKLFENAPEGATELAVSIHDHEVLWVKREGSKSTGWSLDEWDTHDVDERYKTIATLPQPERKTVEDAVAAVVTGFDGDGLWYSPRRKQWIASPEYMASDSYLVCTREEFEACVAGKSAESEPHFKATRENLEKIAKDARGNFVEVGEAKSEPEWTHTVNGSECVLLDPDKDCDGYYIAKTHYGAFELAKEHELKPIKPTIATDRALWLMKTMCPDEWSALERKYTITN